ncbi:hypothetical protein M434DRAFT_35996 [Hypoxylon sp. CO27-5]|nr:hypothetical protein M434DRAFT_35996 [Hypoxylon sp. CO27-5]
MVGSYIGSAQSTTLECDYKWITQPIDHFGLASGTFQQRCSIFDEFYKPEGPIMLFQGKEGWYLDCANTTVMYEYAKQLGGLAVSLEHRYFGQSLPFGQDSHTPSNMKYLTLDNVMADAVSFIDYIKETHNGASDSKAIVASGSYGGFLAAAFRLNHPDTIFESLASCQVVLNRTFWMWFGAPGQTHVSCFNPGFIRTGVSFIETRPFDYITCTYIPLKSSNVPEGTIG